MAFFQVAFFTWALQLQVTSADLPVHCLRHQIAGDWEFTMGPLESKRSACGHKKPDDQYGQPPMNFLEGKGSITKRRIALSGPNVASAEDGSTGTWTMIYDEGFEVDIGDLSFFAFSKFEYLGDDGKSNNVSHCDQTQIGWYHDTARSRWGCYFGRKTTDPQEDTGDSSDPPLIVPSSFSTPDVAPADATTVRPKRLQSLSWLSSQLLPDSLVDEKDANDPGPEQATTVSPSLDSPYAEPPEYKPWVPSSAGYDRPMPSAWQKSVADALNFLQLGWHATTYHMFTGKTPRELNKFAGVRRHRSHAHSAQAKESASKPYSSFLGITSTVRRTVWSNRDDSFDWRNQDGQNWLEPVVSQGDCGSCYTIATVHMLTARNRIRKKSRTEPSFSISFPLYCSEYNQGCDGGYGFLQSKWSEDVGLVPKHCAPFSTGGGSCQVSADCDLGDKRYRAMNHHYVGGFYGGAEAEIIRQELLKNGPVVMSFEPKEDFMYYKSGVYKSSPNKIHQEWEQVDHAVLLIGYGAEHNGQPFWNLQNSWGRDWGEGGYFRMARGSDESGCESIVVAADVVEEASNPILDDFISSL